MKKKLSHISDNLTDDENREESAAKKSSSVRKDSYQLTIPEEETQGDHDDDYREIRELVD